MEIVIASEAELRQPKKDTDPSGRLSRESIYRRLSHADHYGVNEREETRGVVVIELLMDIRDLLDELLRQQARERKQRTVDAPASE